MKKVSFIIPAFNAQKTVAMCIESVIKQNQPKEIILIDNNSSDNTRKIAKKYPITVLSETRRGAGAARNKGINESNGEYIAFIDSDCILPKDWTKKALEKIKPKRIAGVGGPGISVEKSIISLAVDSFLYGRGNKVKKEFVNSLATMNVLYKREAIGNLRFDEDFKNAAGEDPDLCLKIIKKGYILLYDRDLWVKHYHATTLYGLMKRWYRYGKNHIKLCSKHKELRTKNYYAMVLYFPLFFTLILFSVLFFPLTYIASFQIIALFVKYLIIGVRNTKGIIMIVFPFIHTLKQLAQLFGIFVSIFRIS